MRRKTIAVLLWSLKKNYAPSCLPSLHPMTTPVPAHNSTFSTFFSGLFSFFVLQAFHAGMYGARYAWLIPGWFNKKWWKIRLKNESVACTEDEMNKAVKGYIACDNLKISPDNTITVSGQVAKSLYNIPTDKRGVRLFRVAFCLCSKTSPRANLFIWKWVWLEKKWNCRQNIFHMDCSHGGSFSSSKVDGQRGNSLLCKSRKTISPLPCACVFKASPRATLKMSLICVKMIL